MRTERQDGQPDPLFEILVVCVCLIVGDIPRDMDLLEVPRGVLRFGLEDRKRGTILVIVHVLKSRLRSMWTVPQSHAHTGATGRRHRYTSATPGGCA